MTSIVGVLCKDGVVIGADSSATFGPRVQHPTIEQRYEKKIDVVGGSVLIACTGAIGLAQRLVGIVHAAWHDTTIGSQMRSASPLEIAKYISQATIKDFQETEAPKGGLGALIAVPTKKGAQLIEFDLDHFQPELKTEQLWYCSMGSAQPITDPFLGLMREIFWTNGCPSLQDAIFAVTWTLQHAVQVNPGGVNGPISIAALEPNRQKGSKARILERNELQEHQQHIEAAKQTLRDFMTAQSAGSDQALDLPQVLGPLP